MNNKIKGVRTGTVDAVTDSGDRVKWVPKSELLLVSNGEGGETGMPERIAANPSARQARDEFFSKDKKLVRDTARLFVGFNVGSEDYWSAGQVYLMAYLLREQQLSGRKGAPAFSFYIGLGAFPGDKIVASERSAQLVFMNFSQSSAEFFEDMFDLAGQLAEWLHQESVLLEAQDGGQVVYLDYIESDPEKVAPMKKAEDMLEKNSHRIEPSVWEMK